MTRRIWVTAMSSIPCSLFVATAPLTLAAAAEARTQPAVFHADAERGRDDADGRSPERAWQTLSRVNGATLIPGDRVLFRRGGLWRGSLHPASGAPGQPVVYAAYGEGAKPILQGSLPADQAGFWVEHSPGIWSTRPPRYLPVAQVLDARTGAWHLHQESGAQVAFTQAGTPTQVLVRLECTASGTASNHIQLWGPEVPDSAPGHDLLLQARARCTIPFSPASVEVMRGRFPWTGYAGSTASPVKLGPDWQSLEVRLARRGNGEQPTLHVSLGGCLPAGAVLEIEPLGLWSVRCDQAEPLTVDVGNIIFDHGAAPCGVKKWKVEDLKAPGDYHYDGANARVLLRSDGNPAQAHASTEFALNRHVVSQGGAHDVVYDGLAVRYGAAHGFGGGNTARLTIRNCDVSYIGGAHQFTTPEGHPVRFGNGIEFWDAAADNLVENCRVWEIYDAALTNQGRGPVSREVRIVYRNNTIWNSEYSFEYWNGPAEALTEDILFENNTCVDAGLGWAHAQRPDRNGGHLMFYNNSAQTHRFVVRNNIFCDSTEVCLRMDNDWRAGLSLDHNLWFQAEHPLVRFRVKTYYAAADFGRYRQELGMDAASAVGQPRFRDPTARDYRLLADSPGLTLAHDGGPVGARTAD